MSTFTLISNTSPIENHPDFLKRYELEKILRDSRIQSKEKFHVPLRMEIGLQTDLQHDPDIYYFAGGRHVASQTPYNDEYGPLRSIPASIPVILVPMEPHGAEIASESSISQPIEEVVERPKRSNVDEDGWETVRTRSNRYSKKHFSTNLRPRRINHVHIHNNGEEDVMSSSVDEEEIKRKEAALDNAVREEELLEEELLQIEKDFEEIESRAQGEQPETFDAENSTSSPEMYLDESDNENNDRNQTRKVVIRSAGVNTSPMNEQNFNSGEHDAGEEMFCVPIPKDNRKAEEIPPRIASLREKLMSPAKRFDSAETLKRHQAKLEKAERNREKLLQAKYNRYVELSERFEALNETTRRLMEERAILIKRAEERRKRAEEKRQEHLKEVKRKAHDEDSKAREIAFINEIEAENKRLDYLASAQGIEERLQGREAERRQKLEERGAKLSAVIERQSRIRSNWEIKLKILEEKRIQSEERIAREKREKAKERTELALGKARDREERISALSAAKEAEKKVLQKKIQQKQEDTARRHEENMEHIRQKAIEFRISRTTDESVAASTVRMCTVCNVIMHSEVQELAHVRAKSHLEAVRNAEKSSAGVTSCLNPNSLETFGFKFIADVQIDKLKEGVPDDKGRLKVMKKHSKNGREFEDTLKMKESTKSNGMNSVSRIQKTLREINKLVSVFTKDKGNLHSAHALDRFLTEARKLAVTTRTIQDSLVRLGAMSMAQQLLECTSPDLPNKVLISTCNFLIGAIYQNLPNCMYLLRSTCICSILELISSRWNALVPEDNRWLCGSPIAGRTNEPLPVDPVLESAVELLFNILNVVPDPLCGIRSSYGQFLTDSEKKLIQNRTLEIIGYLVASGVVDRFTVYCSGVRGPVDKYPQVAVHLQISLDFLIMLIYALKACGGTSKAEPTMLLTALESSELAGAVSMSYALLFHQGAPARPRQQQPGSQLEEIDKNASLTTSGAIPPPPGPLTVTIVKCALGLINAVASLEIHLLQNLLSTEAVSLQFRHIASQLLWQVVPHRTEDTNLGRLLKELLIALGNFTVCNKLNQATIQSGQTPTVLQQLCSLSFEYSSDPKLSSHYIPTLIAASYGCPENEAILTQHDIKREELEGFMKSEFAKVNAITKRLLQSDGSFSYESIATTVMNQNTASKKSSGKKNKKSQLKASQ